MTDGGIMAGRPSGSHVLSGGLEDVDKARQYAGGRVVVAEPMRFLRLTFSSMERADEWPPAVKSRPLFTFKRPRTTKSLAPLTSLENPDFEGFGEILVDFF